MVQTYCKICFESDFYLGKEELEGILTYLKSEVPDLEDDELFELRVIYNELINNAIIHGNRWDRNKKVELSIEIGEEDITSTVRDEGSGFDYTRLFKKPYNVMREHGRGLQLVCTFADFINFNDRGNEITFQKKIK